MSQVPSHGGKYAANGTEVWKCGCRQSCYNNASSKLCNNWGLPTRRMDVGCRLFELKPTDHLKERLMGFSGVQNATFKLEIEVVCAGFTFPLYSLDEMRHCPLSLFACPVVFTGTIGPRRFIPMGSHKYIMAPICVPSKY